MKTSYLRRNRQRLKRNLFHKPDRSNKREFYKRRNYRLKDRLKNIPAAIRKFVFSLKFLYLFLILSILGGLYYIGKRKMFNIHTIEISEIKYADRGEINNIVDIKGRNIFFVNVNKFEQEIMDSSTFIKSVYLEKILPDKIVVQIEERSPYFVWRTINGAYLIDENGVIIEAVSDSNITLETAKEDIDKIKLQDIIITEEELDVQRDTDVESEVLNQDANEKGNDSEYEDVELKRITVDPALLDYEKYFQTPAYMKKYPLIKIWSDDIYVVLQSIDDNLLKSFVKLQDIIVSANLFEITESIIFSEKQVLIVFDDSWSAVFRLDNDIETDMRLLVQIYSDLRLGSIEFKQIDMRYKRPVLRK